MTEWVNQYEIAAAVIMLVLLVLHTSERKIYTKLSYFYTVILIISLCTAIADEAAIYTLANYSRFPIWVNYFTNVLYSIMSNCMYMLYIMYAIYATKMDDRIKQWGRYALLIPGILVITLVMTTPTTGWAFTIEDGVYTQGVGFYFMYAGAVGYVILATGLAIYNRKAISRIQLMAIIYFAFALVICAVCTVLMPEYLLNAFVTVIGLILVYLSMESDLVDSDKRLDTFNGNALNKQIDKSLREEKDFFLVVLRVGNYEKLNASLGYENVDKILHQIAQFLLEKTPGRRVFHLTGVQFVAYMEGDVKDVSAMVRCCEERFSHNFRLKNLKNEVVVPYEITVIHAPEHGRQLEQIGGLIEYSYNEARFGDPRHTLWVDDRIVKEYNRRMIVESALDVAVRNGGFEVHYQPIKCIKTGKFSIIEALVRIRDEYGELIPPEEFVPIAESNGAIIQITDFVLNTVFRFIKDNELADKGVEKVHINLSPYECVQPNLSRRIRTVAQYYGVDTGMISIDLSESTMSYNGMLTENMYELKDINIGFNLDDYGIGYSNMSELVKQSFEIVKIDKSVLWMALSAPNGMKILKNMVRMLLDMNKKVLVEGVETDEQAELLTNMGVDYLQGYLYSRPMQEKEVVAFISGKPRFGL